MSSSFDRICPVGKALGALALVLFAGGCVAGCQGRGATGGCSGAASECCGNPVGVWLVTSACNFPVYSRPAQNYDTSRGYFQPETGATPPATTSGPWCWDISFDKDGNVATPATPMANPDIVLSGTVTFSDDHTYVYKLTAASTTKFHVAHSCFGVNGANVTCAQLATKLTTSPIGVNPVYMSTVMGQPAFACADAGDGCDCTFDYLEADLNNSAVGDEGAWVQEGSVIHHYSISGQGNLFETSPSRRTVRDATFCQNGDMMELSGANGQPLALKSGARSLTLTRVQTDAGAGGSGGAGGDDGGAADGSDDGAADGSSDGAGSDGD